MGTNFFRPNSRYACRDYAPRPGGSGIFDGIVAGVASIAAPFTIFGEERGKYWPNADFASDWAAISGDWWRAVAHSASADASGHVGHPSSESPDDDVR